MDIEQFSHIYLIGIGGIGMSALARYFKQQKYQVAGYDKTETSFTQTLQNEGIDIHYEDNTTYIPTHFLTIPTEKVLVIFTPAIPKDSIELNFFITKGYAVHKRAEVLAWLTVGSHTVAIAGTHGKTSTTAMVSHLLTFAQKPCNAFLGGISQNYNTNLLLSQAPAHLSYTIAEADEYDKSFLQLSPQTIVLNSIEADHLDIYGDEAQVVETYQQFIEKIQPQGKIFLRKGIEQHLDFSFLEDRKVQLFTFGIEDEATYQAKNIRIENHQFVFELWVAQAFIQEIALQVAGIHNVINATAALAVASQLGIDWETAIKGITSYKGVKRRFQYLHQSQAHVLIDDYAHHPTEIAFFLRSVRMLYPEKPLLAIFQPHLFTRTRDFLAGFAQSLSLADEVWLLPIYPAREQPIESIDAEKISDLITLSNKEVLSKEAIKERIMSQKPPLVVTIGAGDIDALALELAERLGKML